MPARRHDSAFPRKRLVKSRTKRFRGNVTDGTTAAWGSDITQPTLYLHGTQDGCHGMTQEQVNRVPDHCGPGSQSELIDGVGHFLMVQRPTDINKRILEFLAA